MSKENEKRDRYNNQIINAILCGSFESEEVPESKKKAVSRSMYHMYKRNKGNPTNIKALDYKKSCIDYLYGTEKK